jgi:uncharacterized protein YfaS (alpha-2-macroglobulin family)
MVAVAPQIPEGQKGARSPGGGGGAAGAEVLRSRFKTTAFFLGSVVTDGEGNATASAKLPDNLTTFRLMAVAVTAGDRYGSGQSKLLVTRPLLARPALPRFVRPADEFVAGAVVNQRRGETPEVTVRATAEGIALRGDATKRATLEPGRGREVRFAFRAQPADSARFRFDVGDGTNADAVRVAVPVRPDFVPRYHTIAGVLRDTATVLFTLPEGIDPARSTLSLSLGVSPFAIIRGFDEQLRVYPYYCTEQITSVGAPLIALYRASRTRGRDVGAEARMRSDLETAAGVLARRQRSDGGIGLWSNTDWTTPWLTAYAGLFLLDARDAGIAVAEPVLTRAADYLSASLHQTTPIRAPVVGWYDERWVSLRDQVAAADFLSRLGRADASVENELLRVVALMAWEDRLRLAEVIARRGDVGTARRLIEPAWAATRVEGRTAVLPDSLARDRDFYFASTVRPLARLLTATLAVNPAHALVGSIVETLVQQARAAAAGWNTQDFAAAVRALDAFEARSRAAGQRGFAVRAGRRTLLEARATGAGAPALTDSTVALAGLLGGGPNDTRTLRLQLAADGAGDGIVYYFLTVREVPREQPVRPDDGGIRVERWYERFGAAKPVVGVAEGELVRVRLRVTVPAERHFVVLDDALPAGLEAVDLTLRTASSAPGLATAASDERRSAAEDGEDTERWWYGSWDSGWWSPWEHKEMRDDRVVYFATVLWPGTYTATYVARATTPGVFVRLPAQAQEMYNPAVHGRSDGGVFTVTAKDR